MKIKTTPHNQERTHNIVKTILKLTPEAFNSMSHSTKMHYIKLTIAANKHYELQHLLTLLGSDHGLFSHALYKAIKILDKEAITVITNFTKKSSDEYIKNGAYISSCVFEQIYNDDIIHKPNPQLQKEIYLMLIDAKSNTTITSKDLQMLSYITSKQEFEQFCDKKSINITSDSYKDLDLSAYKYETKPPVLSSYNANEHRLIDTLLNRTYSNEMSEDSLAKIYNNIYSLNDQAKESLTYVATLIANGHPLKIIFENGGLAYYSPHQEIIKIDTIFANQTIFNIESVVIHEIGHFVYQQAFNNNAQPINKDALVTSLNEIDMLEFGDTASLLKNYPQIFKMLRTNILGEDFALFKFITTYTQYQAAAVMPFKHAAKLLKVNPLAAAHETADEWAQYLKFNSYIDLFKIKSQSKIFKELLSTETGIDDVTYHTLLEMSYENDGIPISHNRTELNKWARDELHPKIVEKFYLTTGQIHFLERMADLINRVEFFPQGSECRHNNFYSANPLDVELIVRSLELKASVGNETEIIQSFAGLDQYHEQHVSPVICSYLNLHHNITTIQFSNQFPLGNIKLCNITDEISGIIPEYDSSLVIHDEL